MRVRVIGDKTRLDEDIRTRIAELEEASKDNDGLNFQIAINYGSRDEILRAVRRIADDCKDGKKHGRADNIKGKMYESGALCVLICAYSRHNGGNAGAYILTHNNGNGGAVGYLTRNGKRLKYTHRC